jgi:hypothetical protein
MTVRDALRKCRIAAACVRSMIISAPHPTILKWSTVSAVFFGPRIPARYESTLRQGAARHGRNAAAGRG